MYIWYIKIIETKIDAMCSMLHRDITAAMANNFTRYNFAPTQITMSSCLMCMSIGSRKPSLLSMQLYAVEQGR